MMHNDQSQEVSRRGMFFKGLELVSIAPLATFAYDSWDKSSTHYELDTQAAKMGPELGVDKPIVDLFQKVAVFQQALENLDQAHSTAYHKSREVLSPTLNFEGEIEMKWTTEYYWKEPEGLPVHNTIEDWKASAKAVNSVLEKLGTEPLVDAQKLKEVAIKAETGDVLSKQIFIGLIYGTQVGLLLSYEEILAKIRSSNNGTKYQDELENSLNERQHTRRGLLKVVAASLGGAVAYGVSNSISENLQKGEQRLEQSLGEAMQATDVSSAAATSQFIGMPLSQLHAEVNGVQSAAQAALTHNIEDAGVNASYQSLARAGQDYADNLQKIQNDSELEKQLGYLCLCASITQELQSASSSEELLASSAGVLEALGVAGAMAAILLPGEILNEKYPGNAKEESW